MSFGAIASDYDRLRPSATPEAIDWLLPARRDVVVDLAAGTGLLTRLIEGKAAHVIAVEPDDRMRSVLQARSPGVQALAGRGEAIPLPDESADAVLISSAWHWLDPDQAVPEIARVLRDGGRFGAIWTSRDRAIEWLHADYWSQHPDSPGDDGDSRPPGERHRRRITLPGTAPFGNIETTSFSFTRSMLVGDVVDMLTTYSRVITASPEVREAGRAQAAAALAREFPGATEIDVPMHSFCWRADRASRADA